MPNHVINRLEFNCSEERMKEILAAICYDETSDGHEKTGPGTIDFNKITPMPPSLDIESGSRTIDGVSLYLTSLNPDVNYFGKEKMDPEAFRMLVAKVGINFGYICYDCRMSEEKIAQCTQHTSAEELMEIGKAAVHNKLRYGATTWYEWRTRPDTWNTKWNSYYPGDYDGGNEITFQTAWDAPHPIIQKLSVMYPEVEIRHRWANEDYSQSCGSRTYLGGLEIEWDLPDNIRENIEMAAEIWDVELEDCGLLLNAEGTDYINGEYPYFEVMEINGATVLYSEEYMAPCDIPQGTHVYYLSKNLSGEKYDTVSTNSMEGVIGGSIVSKTRIDLGPNGVMKLTEVMQPVRTGEEIGFSEYLNQAPENREVITLG